MNLKARIQEDMKLAMKAREADRLSAIRLLLAAMKQKEVDERVVLDDAAVIAIIDKMLKQRRDSITQYQAAQRLDLVLREQFESEVLTAYLPQALTESEIDALIAQAIVESGANALQQMGQVMALLKPKMAGRADMAQVSTKIRARLGA